VGGDVHGAAEEQFERLLKAVRERGRRRAAARPPVVPAACRPGAGGGGLLPDLTMRRLAPLSGISPATGAGSSSGRGPSSRSSRSPLQPVPRTGCGSRTARSPRSATARPGLGPHLPVLRERAGHHRCRHAPGRGRRPPGPGQQGRRPRVAHLRPAAAVPGVTVPGDGACINTGPIVPHRKRPGRPPPAGEEAGNAEHRRWVRGSSRQPAG
jgi:hypothetical protein